ncbi:hypothetical protein NDN08_006243 [Rhodosorus marinus]|uniref:Ferredoxin thioredoxin reductase alpha chain domain-containing protein n=1 Tax=Rhodosorus marinus TaxID=101924 RepID=A0AAV8UK50_9RHOD|nr:hypothetical protein NDN08_006243 [Rhodosorus marinus]
MMKIDSAFIGGNPTGIRRTRRRCLCMGSATPQFESGVKVRVKSSVIMYHLPSKRGQEVDVKGLEGEVQKTTLEKDGVPLTLNRPVLVKFTDPRFSGHFAEDELEPV